MTVAYSGRTSCDGCVDRTSMDDRENGRPAPRVRPPLYWGHDDQEIGPRQRRRRRPCSRYRFFHHARHDDRRPDAHRGPVGRPRQRLESVQVDIVMMRTPDGHGKLELTKFRNPRLVEIEPAIAPPNALGLRSVMFTVESVDDTVARLRANGAELVGEVAQYEDKYRLCYMRGPAGIIVALAESSSERRPHLVVRAMYKKVLQP